MSDSRGKSASQRAKNPLDTIPRPEGHLFTIRAVAFLVKRSEGTIYNVLSLHADRFGEAMYQKVYAPRDQRLYRLLSEADMAVIRALFPVYVKRKGVSRNVKGNSVLRP